MKRVIDGVAYNTDTATLIAFCEQDDEDDYGNPVEDHEELMVTRSGAYFLFETGRRRRWDGKNEVHEWRDFSHLVPLSPDEARQRLGKGDWQIVDETFAEFPEATAEEDVGATLYVRMPARLKRRIDEAARKEGVSANVLAMRCLESCLKQKSSTIPQLPFDIRFLKYVSELQLSVRSENCLKKLNIVYLGDLVQKTGDELFSLENFGRKSYNEIRKALAPMGLHLGMELPGWPPENLEQLASRYNEVMQKEEYDAMVRDSLSRLQNEK